MQVKRMKRVQDKNDKLRKCDPWESNEGLGLA